MIFRVNRSYPVYQIKNMLNEVIFPEQIQGMGLNKETLGLTYPQIHPKRQFGEWIHWTIRIQHM